MGVRKLAWLLALSLILSMGLAGQARAMTVAVFDLEPRGLKIDKQLLERLGTLLAVKLAEAGHAVISPDRLREQAMGMKKCANYACRSRLAGWLGASRVLISSALRFEKTCKLTLELRPADGEVTLWAASEETSCSPQKLMKAVDALAERFAERFPTSEPAAGKSRRPPSPDPQPKPAAKPKPAP